MRRGASIDIRFETLRPTEPEFQLAGDSERVALTCAGLGVLLAAVTGASALDGYLATTPGGVYAVLATATGSGADATFVLSVQVLRLFVMLLSAPLVARVLRRRGRL